MYCYISDLGVHEYLWQSASGVHIFHILMTGSPHWRRWFAPKARDSDWSFAPGSRGSVGEGVLRGKMRKDVN